MSSVPSTLRVALLGCGKISENHVSAIGKVDGAELVAVCDRDRYRAEDTAAGDPAVAVHTDVEAMLRESRPDVVHILTPPSSHADLAVQVMDAGCHALVEKPMAVGLDEADRMLAAASRNGVRLATNHNYLFKPSVQQARDLVAAGEIGDVLHVNGYYGMAGEGGSFGAGKGHWVFRLRGGVFTNFLPHLVYLVDAFVDVQGVPGVTLHGEPGGIDTELTVLVDGAQASGTMLVTMRAQPYAKYIEVFGTKGVVRADLVREICVVHREQRLPRMLSKATYSLEESVQLAKGTVSNVAKVVSGTMRNMPELPPAFTDFYDGIRAGRDSVMSGQQGRKMVQVMEWIWERSPEPAAAPVSTRPVPAPRTAAERRVQAESLPGKVLVTGATGFLGGHLVGALARVGAEVVAPVRDRSRVSFDLEQTADIVQLDLRDPDRLQALLSGVAVVFHCAAVTSSALAWAVHEQVNVNGTKAVLDAAVAAGVKRLVHASSVTVYGLDTGTGPVGEGAPYASGADLSSPYVRSKAEADRMVLAYADREGLGATVLRMGLLYGPGGGYVPGRGLVQLGKVRLGIGSGENVLPYTYVGNAVDAMLLAAIVPEAVGQAYNVVDGIDVTVAEAARRDAEVTGQPLRVVPVPAAVVTAAGAAFELRNRLKGSDAPPKLSRWWARNSLRSVRYDTAKARRDLGWHAEVGLDDGLRSMQDGAGAAAAAV